ncbi:S-adenosyl-L-methionine-dependent methyltransferase [Lindgomyces ingoldianus]|uniref:S-adenosyl-L-methionine-dependent methyltransferase n=1 Tax=Lindgomyces ingoldianus TaxID=673940 RepID=A0ACB6QRT4_9PLEO|nr:S-adenosyl-L-methionine-dependent methyltransferase [Lindgomyces ingoldianus]KAF2469693.1 S-adenosyl-L-methionine-dependent methyltransferase [Lindgomyces ingoldianus]
MNEDLRVVNIHDRDFQKYSVDNRIYCVPIDEREEERLESQHDLLLRLSGNRLFFPRIENPRKILDCGYGRGDWAVAIAEEYEDCQVTGIDIYPVLISDQPDNLYLYGFNLNDRLNDPEVFERNAYNLIHSRFVAPGIKKNRWRSYIRDMKALMRPGGWLQMAEYYLNIQSGSGRLSSNSALRRWWEAYSRALEDSNRNPRVGQKLQEYMTEAGLRDVGGTVLHLPIGAWDPDPTRSAIGRDCVGMVCELLDSLAIWPLTEKLGWTAAQVKILTDAARVEIQDVSLKLYIPM